MPILTHTERQRLLQAIVFFASHTDGLGKIKLFKLLYLFDFEHFRQTGKSATGLDYRAWKLGPVPLELMDEWEQLGGDLSRLIYVHVERIIDYDRQAVRLQQGVAFDPDPFSPRQLRILQELAQRHRSGLSEAMIDVTHAPDGPWARTWRNGEGRYEEIPYELAITDADPAAAPLLEVAREQAMYRAAVQAGRRADPD